VSLATITPKLEVQRAIRSIVESVIDGVIGVNDAIDINLPDPLTVTKTIHNDHLEVTWKGKIEANIPGPINPDIIRLKCWPTETRVYLRLDDIRIIHKG
jgi:hypothetical protein